MQKKDSLLIGIGSTILLLVIFIIFQSLDASFLKLPIHWLALALLPALFSLIIGGYISKFKGFGVELESAIQAPVTSLDLTASDALADIPGDEKRSMTYLDNMSRSKANSIRWLLFTSGKRDYYGEWAVNEYLRRLPNLEFFEIRSKSGEIICFIPIEAFKNNIQDMDDQFDSDRIRSFIEAINEDRVASEFADLSITLRIQSNAGLVDVLKRMRSENTKLAAVISETGRYIGVVFARDIESRIADSVLNTQKG